MTRSLIISLGGLFLCILSLPFVIFQVKDSVKKLGNSVFLGKYKFSVKLFFIYFMAISLLVLLLFRNFSHIMKYVMAICAVLAVYLANKILVRAKYVGVYENGIVIPQGAIIFFSDIKGFSDFDKSDEVPEKDRNRILVIETKQNGKLGCLWRSSEECQKVKDALKKLNLMQS